MSVGTATARIGADAAADLVVADPTVAANHATLRLQGGVWLLEDHGADGGSWVDGHAVTAFHPVAPGSVIRLGTVELIFDPQDSWADSPAPAVSAAEPMGASPQTAPALLFTIEPARSERGWLPWLLVGAVVLVAVAAIILSGGSR